MKEIWDVLKGYEELRISRNFTSTLFKMSY